LAFLKEKGSDAALLVGLELDSLHSFDSSGRSNSIDDRAHSRCVHVDRHRRHGGSTARACASLASRSAARGSSGFLIAPQCEYADNENRNYRQRSEKSFALRYPPRLRIEPWVRHFIVSSD
jgi:hypothetical protein